MLPITMSDPRSLTMKNGLDEFLPTDVIRIVDGYFAHSDAVEVLSLDDDGEVVDSEFNRQTAAAIKIALATGTCDREVIRLIFRNADEGAYAGHLNVLMNEMRAQEIPIILDDVDFSGLDLAGVQFDLASMTKANFSGAQLNGASFLASDLSGSTGFASARGDVTVDCDTTLSDTTVFFDATKLRPVLGNKSVLIALVDTPQKIDHVLLTGYGHKIWIKFVDAVLR